MFKSYIQAAFYSIVFLLIPFIGKSQTLFSENFQGWTSVGSYSTSSTNQVTSAGTWSFVSTIISPTGAANGTGSKGLAQLQASNGILTFPNIASGGASSINFAARASGANGGFTVEKKIGASGSWTTVQTVTVNSTVGINVSATVNDNSNDLQLRVRNTGGSGGRALYLHDIAVIAASPVINTSVTSLSGYTTFTGTPSAVQSFTVSGGNLTNNLVLTAPAGFEISTSSNSGFGTTITLNQSGGTVATTTIYVRMTGAGIGAVSGNISLASTGATAVNFAVSGTVNYVAPVANAASNIDETSFTANWSKVNGVSSYLLDVSTNANFGTSNSGTLSENFDAYTSGTIYNGWVFDATLGSYTNASSAGAAPNSLKFLSSGSLGSAISPVLPGGGTATQLSFLLLNNSANNTYLALDAMINGTWVAFDTIRNNEVDAAPGTTFTYNASSSPVLPTGATQFRFTYVKTGSGNFAMDDVSIAYNTFSGSFVPGYNGLQVNDTTASVSGLTTGTPYYYRVRSTDGTNTSANSNRIAVTPVLFSKYQTIASGDYSNTFTWQGWDGTQWVNYPAPPHTLIDEVAVNHNVNLTSSATIKTLTLNNFTVTLGNNDLTVIDPIVNGGATAYIKTNGAGGLKINVAGTPVVFPVGNSTYNPVTLTNTGTDNFSVRVADAVYNDGYGVSPATTTAPVVNHTWYITPDAASGNSVTMTMQWTMGEEINHFDYNHAFVKHYNGSQWENYLALSGLDETTAPAANNVSGNMYSVTQTAISSFSPFTVGGTSIVPLAIHLTALTAINKGSVNIISWKIASFDDGDKFVLEHSNDAKTFTAVTMINANDYNYSFTDKQPFNGANYYRLRMIDKAGNNMLSKVVIANTNATQEFTLKAYPNPVADKLFVATQNAGSNATITITDVTGKILKTITVDAPVITIDMNHISTGIYLLHYADDTHTEEQKIIK